MDLEATLRSLSALADATARRRTLDVIARQLDASAVLLAIADHAQPARFTAPNGAPTWPDSSCWSDLLERCKTPGLHTGSLMGPGETASAPAVGYAFPPLAIVVVGHSHANAELARAFDTAAPLLSALLRAEQQVVAARRHALAHVGEELREPLAPIASAVQLLRLETTPTRVHDILERQVARLLRLVDELVAEGEQHAAGSQRSPSAPAAQRPSAPGSTSRAASAAVLVVDDNQDAADLLGTLLASLGYTVRVAHTGPDGLALLADFTPDIALLDIGLPGMDGYELARELHARLPGLPLIAITGYGQDKDRARARDAGFAAHLVKPVSIANLSEALGELLDSRGNTPSRR